MARRSLVSTADTRKAMGLGGRRHDRHRKYI